VCLFLWLSSNCRDWAYYIQVQLLWASFNKWGNWGSERLSHSWSVTDTQIKFRFIWRQCPFCVLALSWHSINPCLLLSYFDQAGNRGLSECFLFLCHQPCKVVRGEWGTPQPGMHL
jgi:hypothetical protein